MLGPIIIIATSILGLIPTESRLHLVTDTSNGDRGGRSAKLNAHPDKFRFIEHIEHSLFSFIACPYSVNISNIPLEVNF
jgi:hypothetical protein